MRYYCLILVILLGFSPKVQAQEDAALNLEINDVLNTWHTAAATADEETYFKQMTSDAVFIGTDAEENWNRADFEAYARPHFKRGKAWNFSVLRRNIFISDSKEFAWFDELLDTPMGVCRGSGVLVLQKGSWKINQYVLSITVPNEKVEALGNIKQEHDQLLIQKLKKSPERLQN